MEEGSVLVVLEAFVEFVLPNDASSALEIDYLEVESCFYEVTNKDNGALNTGVAPL